MERRDLSLLVATDRERPFDVLQSLCGALKTLRCTLTRVASLRALQETRPEHEGALVLIDAALLDASPADRPVEDALCALWRHGTLVLADDDAPAHHAAWIRRGAMDSLCWKTLGAGDLERALHRALARRDAAHRQAREGAWYRIIVESAQDVVTVLGPDATIRYESPSIERVLGYAPDELIGTSALDYIHPDDLPPVVEALQQGVQTPGYTAAVEYRFRHKDGSWRTLESRAKNLLHDPHVAGIVVNSRDVTDRREAVEALGRSEMRTRALLDALPDAMVHLSRDGTYLDVHLPRDYRAFTDPEALRGRSALDVLPSGVSEQAMACLEQALATGEMQSFEYEIDVDGERRVREARVMRCGPDEVISIQRDVTERKRAEADLRESERRFRQLFESSPDAIFVESLEGRVLDANPAACRLHGLARDALVGRSVQELVPPDRRAGDLEDFTRLKVGEVGYMESFSLHSSGRVIPVEIRATRTSYGRHEAVLLHVRDITERREAETRIKQLKAFYEQVLHDIPADVAVMDPDGRILFLNPASVRDPEMRAWLVGRTGIDYCRRRGIDPTLAQERHRRIQQAVAERRIVQFEETIETASGEKRHILRMASPVIGPDGSVNQVIGYGLDITERKRAEEALRKNEALLRTVVSNIPVILFALDRDGTFTLAEGKGLEALSSAPGEAVGRSVHDLYRRLPAFVRDVERALDGETFSSLIEVSGRAFECWLSPMTRVDGTISGAIGVAADVTEMKRKEAALEQSQAQLRDLALHLQSVREEERTRISREVHDVLGQALTALRMDVAWLERGLDAEDPLHERTASMKQLIDTTIQTVRRIASDLRPGVLDDLGLAAALEWEAQQFDARTGVACSFSDHTGFLELDRDRSTAVFRIFQEILTNVARHAGASHVDITLTEGDGLLRLIVRDDGRGIRREELENKKSLGLLGMRERVVPWGGRVDIQGTPEAGTTVTVTVPLWGSTKDEGRSAE